MRLALLILPFVILVSACSSTRHSAPIVERSPSRAEARPAVAAPRQMDSRGFYTVRKGDTLLQIAQDFGQNFRDLVTWNNLSDANDIRIDQVLRVVPPPAAQATPQPSASVPAPAVEVKPLPAAVPHKSTPRADKQPYSDSALAEMEKPDAAPGSATRQDAKPQERTAEAPAMANGEESGIAWMWPTEGALLSGFDSGKKGLDIGGKAGQPIVAAAAGKVMYAGSGIRGYGNLVIVKHTPNLLSAYAHNKTILVKEGQNVAKGEKIAEMGNTDADTVKLHFEIRQQGKPVDPAKFLPKK